MVWAAPREAQGIDGALGWDFDVAVPLPSRKEAQALDASFPGAEMYYARATEGAHDSADLKIRPGNKGVHVTLTLMDAHGEEHKRVLDDVKGEVRHIKARLTQQAQVQIVRIRVAEVLRDIPFAGLVLGKRVNVSLVMDQAEMFTEDGVQVGQVVTYRLEGDTRIGRVTAVDEDEVVVDNFGRTDTIFAREVVQQFRLEAEGATPVDEHLDRYVQAAAAVDALPNWSDLLEAIANTANDGEVASPGATTQYVNDAVIDRAIEDLTPPEAG